MSRNLLAHPQPPDSGQSTNIDRLPQNVTRPETFLDNYAHEISDNNHRPATPLQPDRADHEKPFQQKNKPVYADHLSDLEGIEHPYFPRKTVHSDQPASKRLPDNHRRPDHYGPARTTLDALQIIRRRFEEQTNNQSDEDQAAA